MRYIALLRAVNVGGNGSVKMADLRALGEGLGFSKVQTLLQSGNLTFETDEEDIAGLEARWERGVEEELGVRTAFFLRAQQHWRAIIAANPFKHEATADPSHLLVLATKECFGDEQTEALRNAIKGAERVEPRERCLYAVYPDGIGRSKLTTKLIERHLGTLVTGRNWNTVLKLVE